MALTSGTKLGPYEIQSPLGADGQGAVWNRNSSATTQLELSPDGQRLLLIQAPVQDSANLTLVVNWRQELKK